MILFERDFDRYPNAIVDTKTKNESFLRLASIYKQMGIKNYYFHLALLQPELQGVDPFDPDLPFELQVKWMMECRNNPWAFYREVFRLPSQGSSIPDPLRANRGNIGAYWLYFNHQDVCLVQPRQTGKSVGADGINTYVIQVAGRSATFSLITKDHKLRSTNIQRLKDMRDALPAYMNQYQPKVDTNNPFGITVTAYGNEVSTGVAQSSEAGALNLGRGQTSESNQIDEGPFCKNIHVTIPAFLASGNAARENAAKHGSFYGNIFTTTAGKLDTKEGAYMYEMFMGGMPINERALFDAQSKEEVNTIVRANSKGTKALVYMSLSHRQLGLTDDWLYDKMSVARATGDEADRDFMNRWTTGALTSPLTQKQLEAISQSVKPIDYPEISDRSYLINWYVPEHQIAERLASGQYVLGNDCSEAVGRDSITMVLSDVKNLETIFTVDISETNVYSFIEWFAKIMIQYPTITAIVERKSVGVVVIDALIIRLIASNINPFERLYNTIIEDGLHLTQDEFSFLRRDPVNWPTYVADKYKMKFGYGTAGAGRHKRTNLYKETLKRAVDLAGSTIYDDTLVSQMKGLIIKNERVDHAVGKHDDMVIAWLLNAWLLIHSKNLDYYGIKNPLSQCISLTKRAEIDKQPQGWDRVRDIANEQLIHRIQHMVNQLNNCDDWCDAERLETQIQQLSKRVVSKEIDSGTIGELINKSREYRENRLKERKALHNSRTDAYFMNAW